MTVHSINPATGEVIETFTPFTAQQVDAALGQAHAALATWRQTTLDARGALLRRAATYLRDHAGDFAWTITREMGKPITEARAEIEKCAWACDTFAEQAPRYLAPQPIASNARESYVEFVPLGVVLAIMPWNYPFWQVFRFAVAGLMAGNTAVLKHASNVWRSALEVERVFQESGFPVGVFRTVLVSGEEAERLISDPRVAAVTLTGSMAAGQRVAATAGREIKKCVLELGGSDPFIVLADADLDGAARMAVRARFQNDGQSCIAAKRFIVVEAVAEEFERRVTEAAAALRIGDPREPETQIGPMARADLRETLERQVARSVAMGARVALGGEALPGSGFYYAPTVLTQVTSEMPVFREETFGPVAAIIRARDAEHAVALANDSQFGLGGNLWTGDLARGRELARRIESGNVFINGMTTSDPRLPFGGVKRSGFGRELSSFGIHEFTNIQTIWIGPAEGAQQPPPRQASA